jgi:hypothetical protein
VLFRFAIRMNCSMNLFYVINEILISSPRCGFIFLTSSLVLSHNKCFIYFRGVYYSDIIVLLLHGEICNIKQCIYSVTTDKSNTTGATSGTGTTYLSGPPRFTPDFSWGSCCSIFSFLRSVL